MIPRSLPKAEPPGWLKILRDGFSSVPSLYAALKLPLPDLEAASFAAQRFALRVPAPYVARMIPGNPNDPLLRQVLPVADELDDTHGFTRDPVGDLASVRAPGLLHKYHGRALLMVSGGCAVNCRYCFRREFPYHTAVGTTHLQAALQTLAQDTSVHEIILSGGDPLMLLDEQFAALCARLESIPHLKRLRIHSRLPVVIPARVTRALLETLSASRLPVALVLHINHAQEIDKELSMSCAALRERGITLLNQAVLLRGVNDSADTLAALSERLFECGVLPYYLHMLDRVRGAAHFEVPEANARAIHHELRLRLPGYLVPRLVREVAGAPYKVPLAV